MSCFFCNDKNNLQSSFLQIYGEEVWYCASCKAAVSATVAEVYKSYPLDLTVCSYCCEDVLTELVLHGMCKPCTYTALECYADTTGLSFIEASQLLVAIEHGCEQIVHAPKNAVPRPKRTHEEVSEDEGRYVS